MIKYGVYSSYNAGQNIEIIHFLTFDEISEVMDCETTRRNIENIHREVPG